MSGATPGSWHAELAEAHAAINELAALVLKQDAELVALRAELEAARLSAPQERYWGPAQSMAAWQRRPR